MQSQEGKGEWPTQELKVIFLGRAGDSGDGKR